MEILYCMSNVTSIIHTNDHDHNNVFKWSSAQLNMSMKGAEYISTNK